ncbi:hypothetical protein CBR_g28919 [Chara braunii]|uniref:RNA-binding protein AU-1/Ribonuclease E/G domain-containing protein n=1 Tax=Chara braunii TaxID=69332 RepID=A0A388LAJ2_CHABU|nr:hypothetical protein CBR_g28919 [Chara braunii]|eukprot:GBG79202.1 hypothetical protein CBR_g28919 [Chara braunii]
MVGVSQKISGQERARLKSIAKRIRPAGFSLIVRTEACDHGEDELEKDVVKLMETWREILVEAATAAAAAAVTSTNAILPTILHRAMGPTVAVVRDMFTDKVERMVVDSESSYQEVRREIMPRQQQCHVSNSATSAVPHQQQCHVSNMSGPALGMPGQLANESLANYKQRFQTQLALIEAEEQRQLAAEAAHLQAEAAATAEKQRLQAEADADAKARRKEA